MRDIVRDAAIITVAKHVMETDDAWMNPTKFAEEYADTAEDRTRLMASLAALGLVWEAYERKPWTLDGEYIWRWINEK